MSERYDDPLLSMQEWADMLADEGGLGASSDDMERDDSVFTVEVYQRHGVWDNDYPQRLTSICLVRDEGVRTHTIDAVHIYDEGAECTPDGETS